MSYLDLTKPRVPTRATAGRALEHLAAELNTADFICDQSPLEYLGLEGVTSDAAPRHLFREALTLYNDANREYLAGRHTNPSLMLESAKRGTRHQALLYVRWFWWKHTGGASEGIGRQNEANAPGKSLHEYGFAIDVVRGGQARRIQSILQQTGWLNGLEAEGWHFEAVQAPARARLLTLIQQEALGPSDAFKALVSDFLYTRQACRDLLPDFLREKAALQVEIDRMQRQRDALDREKTRLDAVKRGLDRDANVLSRKRDAAVRLRRDYNNMIFRCPNGEPEPTCTHFELKRQFQQRKEQARPRVEAEESEVVRMKRDLDSRVRAYDDAVMTHNNNVAAWERYKIDWERRNKSYVDLKRRIERMDQSLRDLGQRIATGLTNLEATVSSILARL